MQNTIKIIFIAIISSFFLACNHSTSESKKSKTNSMQRPAYHVINKIINIGDARVHVRNEEIIDYHKFKPVGNKDAVFSDSVLKVWNNATINDIAMQFQKYNDSTLIRKFLGFSEGDCIRLEFAKFCNKEKLISKKKINNMILIEYVRQSTANSCHIITIDSDPQTKKLLCTNYYYSYREETWLVHSSFYVDKLKFNRWIKRVKRRNKKCVYLPYSFKADYIVSFFEKDGIKSKFFLTPFEDIDLER